ncbi:unnamed protein product [Allacma fusca]|uniref:Uncharacterized protein n=1 Tax=Allacma fusca TaxID=39272 RepID=A0A8J2PW35_9HEXA|nr:unnamed protein product [Allacma fusca]
MDYLQLWNFILWAGGTFRSFTFLELSYLEWIGLLWTLAWIVYCIPYFINTLYCIWIAPVLGHYANLRKMGKWAVVTGASDGIGKAYAEEIARLGVNVVLISRSKSKLDDLARELGEKFGVQTKVVSVDFTEGLHIYDEIQKELEGLEIGTLVNNIGIFYPYVEYFTERPNARKHSQDMIFCNVFPVTFMTHMILPQMCSRGRGVIINIGSYLGTIPCPLNSMYSGTKAFTERFTESLSMEYEKSGVIIQAVIPEYVSTRMSGVTKPSWTTPSAKEYVRKALKTVGVESRTSVYIPHRLAILAHETGIFLWRRFGSRAIFNVFLHLRANSKHRLAVLKQSQRT